MAEIPQHQRPRIMRQLGNGGHVIDVGTFENGVGQRHQGGVVVNGGGQRVHRPVDVVGGGDDLDG